jgi:streptogramin lyase/C4-type Zn-finger protein
MFIVKKLSCRRLAIISASALIFQSSIVFAGTKVYTSDADFDLGVMDGVEHSTTPNQLQLSVQGSTLPFIWVANSGESTVSKMNTETGCELGRYRTGPSSGSGENPSRTTVDINGDLWVGNRSSDTATKIALTPTDTNGDGTITTSQDTNGNCLIEPDEVLAWGTDEAVLLRIEVDSGPRGVAIDANNNVWIGGYSGARSMGYYDGETGALIKTIPLGIGSYGALIDSHGTLWIAGRTDHVLVRIDNPAEDNHTITTIPAYDIYGMSIDRNGYVYSASWEQSLIRKYDPINSRWAYEVSLASNGRGVTVGLDGDVWVVQSNANTITRHDGATGQLKATVPVGSHPTGAATAADGKIWVTNLDSNNVMRVDPATNAVDFTHEGHTYPYNYSDMTGIISRSITTRSGTWTVVYQEAELVQATVSWTADTPGDSTLTVMAESSVDGVTWSTPQQIQSGVEFNTVANATMIRLVVEFNASTGTLQSPILYDLTVDTPDSSTLQFSSTNYSVNENGGEATITVTRSGNSQGAISANYATSNGTATAGSDYSQTAGTLNWGDGDFDDKTFTIAITDDSLSEGNETFTVSLTDPISGESLDNATVSITDNDNAQPGTPQFTSSTVEVTETASTVTLTVRRVGGTNGELTVNYATTAGTATDGSDYVGATGTLTWADGDSSDKTLTVTIIDDSLSEGNETFTVTLSDPVSGGSLDNATVSITDNDATLVTLVDFSATALETEILLEWQSAFELDNAGFHIWRATGEGWKNGDYSTVIRLTDRLIPAQGNSIPYSYIDSNVESGLTYYYGLEDIDLSGHSTFHLDYIDSATAK